MAQRARSEDPMKPRSLDDGGTRPSGPQETRVVLAGPRVDLHAIAGVHEQRHLDHEARFQACRLACSGDPIALYPWFGLGNGELDGRGEIDPDELALVELDDRSVPLLQILRGVAQGLRAH